MNKYLNTQVIEYAGHTLVSLHNHVILDVVYGESIVIDNCGYNTLTTARRINQIASDLDLSLRVFRKKGLMIVHVYGQDLSFSRKATILIKEKQVVSDLENN